MKMNEHGCVSMKLYQKRQQPVDCGPLNYVTHVKELLNQGFMKQMRPLLFRKQFPPSPNRSVWTLPIEGTAFIEQTCGGGSVCSKVCKFLTATKIVQQITVMFPMYSQTIPIMLSLVFQHQLQGLTKHAINIVIRRILTWYPLSLPPSDTERGILQITLIVATDR